MALNPSIDFTRSEPVGDRRSRDIRRMLEQRSITALDLVAERCALTVTTGSAAERPNLRGRDSGPLNEEGSGFGVRPYGLSVICSCSVAISFGPVNSSDLMKTNWIIGPFRHCGREC